MRMHNPPHPGSVLREYLGERSVTSAAKNLGVTRVALSRVLNGDAGISAEMALRLSEALDTTPELWLGMQSQYDLWQTSRRRRKRTRQSQRESTTTRLKSGIARNAEISNTETCPVLRVRTGFEYWSKHRDLSLETQITISHSDFILVPGEVEGYSGPVFPSGTEEFFCFLQSKAGNEFKVEVAAEDSKYAELTLHADIIRLATILVKVVLAPIAVGLTVDYLKRLLGSRFANTEVRASILVDRSSGINSDVVKVSYTGPARAFEETVRTALSQVADSQNQNTQLERATDSGTLHA